jgi:hypothetical protein
MPQNTAAVQSKIIAIFERNLIVVTVCCYTKSCLNGTMRKTPSTSRSTGFPSRYPADFRRVESEGIIIEDRRQDYSEERFVLLCPFMGKIYHVTFTWREDRIRLISARRAKSERGAGL